MTDTAALSPIRAAYSVASPAAADAAARHGAVREAAVQPPARCVLRDNSQLLYERRIDHALLC